MDKSNQKRNKYNPLVVEQLSKKYGVTATYVRASLRGDRDSLTSETIKKDYKDLDSKVIKALEN